MMIITAQELRKATGCSQDRAELYLPHLQVAMKAFDITNPERMAGFVSQISHESDRLKRLSESLNYSVDGLMVTFRRYRISAADCRRLGRYAGHRAEQEAIANKVYGGAWGLKNLGNSEPGDGWRFRGRGLKQLTGRDNYTRCSRAIGQDLVSDPDLLLLPFGASMSAGWFWSTNNLNAIADRGDVVEMTRVVNGGENGLKERTALYGQALGVFA